MTIGIFKASTIVNNAGFDAVGFTAQMAVDALQESLVSHNILGVNQSNISVTSHEVSPELASNKYFNSDRVLDMIK